MADFFKSIFRRHPQRTSVGTQAIGLTQYTVAGYVSDFFSQIYGLNGGISSNVTKTDGKEIDNTKVFTGDMKLDLHQLECLYRELGERLARTRLTIIEKRTHVDELNREAATHQNRVAKYTYDASLESMENEVFEEQQERNEQRIADLRNERERLDERMAKIQKDVQLCEDNGFEIEENLENLKEIREDMHHIHIEEILALREAANISRVRKMKYSSGTNDFRDSFKRKDELVCLRQALEEVRKQQTVITGVIREQAKEKEFLLERNDQILQKIVGLQKQIEDREGLRLPLDPSCKTGAIITPTTWSQTPGSTLAEVKECLQKAFQDQDLKYIESYDSISPPPEENSESSDSDSEAADSGSDDGEPVSLWPI